MSFLSSFCFVAVLYGCGAGGAASTSGATNPPVSANPGQAATITLSSSARVVNTGNAIPLTARALDSAGRGVSGIAVVFTSSGVGTMSTNYQLTDSNGDASVTIFSTAAGSSTVNAFSNTLLSSLNVYFVNGVIQNKITVGVDSNGNNIYNEPADYTVSTTSGGMSKIRVTFTDGAGNPISNKTITLSSDSTLVSLSSATVTTDNNGNGYVFATFSSPQGGPLANTIFVDITASASDGTVGTIALQVQPFIVGGIQFFSDNYSISTGGMATLTACLVSNNDTPIQIANLGINFTASPATSGVMLPFAFTNSTGCATNTYNAITAGSVALTASFTSVSANLTLNVSNAPQALEVVPAAASANVGDSSIFMITGGVAPYTAQSLNPSLTNPTSWNIAKSGGTFQITAVKAGTANIIISDSVGAQVQVALTITGTPTSSLTATPATASLFVGQPQVIVVTGGTPPYSAQSLNPSLTNPSSWSVTSSGGSFQFTGTNPGIATINISDSSGSQIQVAATITNTVTTSLTATPSTVSLVVGEPQIIVITGGTAPYTVTSLNPSLTNPTSWNVSSSGGSFQVTPISAGSALINIVDSKGTQIQVTLTII